MRSRARRDDHNDLVTVGVGDPDDGRDEKRCPAHRGCRDFEVRLLTNGFLCGMSFLG
jgi:hypothetical protein